MRDLFCKNAVLAILAGPALAESPEVYLEFDKSTPPGNLAIRPDVHVSA